MPARVSLGTSSADRNLLFGILALQMDFISRDALITAMNAWVLDKSKPLGAILVAQQNLSAHHHDLVESLVAAHLAQHGNDPEKSLAAVSPGELARAKLAQIADPEVQGTLARALKQSQQDGTNKIERTTDYQGPKKAGNRFVILRPHASGGLGEVFVALDEELNRDVALKEIRDRLADDDVSRARFVLEAEITGRLEHPGIVPVYSFGQYDDGRPYYAMRFIQGESLKAAIKGYHDGPRAGGGQNAVEFRKLLGAFVDVCQAIHYAHSRGVLHRDLKPDDIVVGEFGEALVVDWGLAKPLDGPHSRTGPIEDSMAVQPLRPVSGSGSFETLAGTALGTPGYMSPEQAAGRLDRMGPASDVYSLGATLYYLLTGQAPFGSTDQAAEVLQRVQKGDFPPPRTVAAHVSRALDAICRKAMALSPGERYPSAKDLAEDLEHWLADEPVTAYRDPPAARLGRWARRHKSLVASAAVLLLTGVAALALGLVFLGLANTQIQHERDRAERQHYQAVTNLYHSLVREAQAIRRAREGGYRAEVWKRLEQALQLATPDKDPQELRQEAVACLGDFVGQDSTAWEDFPAAIVSRTLHPNREQLALGLENGTIQVRRIPSGEVIARLEGHQAAVLTLAFRADGNELISGDRRGRVKVWKRLGSEDWACTRTLAVDPRPSFVAPSAVFPLFAPLFALTSDGNSLLACDGQDSIIVQMDLSNGTTVARFHARKGDMILGPALSPDGKLLAAGIENQGSYGVLIWDVATRTVAKTLSPGLEKFVHAVFSPDGKLLACVHQEGVALYDTATFEQRLFVRGDFPTGAAFRPDSQLVAIRALHLGVIRLWNIATNREIATLACPIGSGVDFSRDGKFLVAGDQRSLRIWNLGGNGERLVLSGHAGGVPDVIFNPDGQLVASAGKDHKIKIWNPTTGALIRELKEFRTPVQALAFTAEGRILAGADYETGTLRFYDVASGKLLVCIPSEVGPVVWSISFSPDDRHFAAGGSSGMKLWRVRHDPGNTGAGSSFTLEPIARLSKEVSRSIVFSPDSRLLAWAEGLIQSNGMNTSIRLWDVQAAQPRTAPTSSPLRSLLALGISPDSKRLAFVSSKPAIEVWDIASGQQAFFFGEGELERRGALPPHTRLSGDGSWYAIGGRAPTIWDLENKKLLLALPGERSAVWCVGWSPNKEQLAVGTADGGLVLWNLPKVRKHLAEIGLDW